MQDWKCLGCGDRVAADDEPERCARCGDNRADNGVYVDAKGQEVPYPVFNVAEKEAVDA